MSCCRAQDPRRIDDRSTRRARSRARLTRLLIVPTAQPQMFGRLLVGEAGGADEQKRLALVVRQLGKSDAEILEVELAPCSGWTFRRPA